MPRRLEDWPTLKPYITNLIAPSCKILMVGCGNAGIHRQPDSNMINSRLLVELSEKMYDDGFCNIENVDISTVVINQMKERNLGRPNMTCKKLLVI